MLSGTIVLDEIMSKPLEVIGMLGVSESLFIRAGSPDVAPVILHALPRAQAGLHRYCCSDVPEY